MSISHKVVDAPAAVNDGVDTTYIHTPSASPPFIIDTHTHTFVVLDCGHNGTRLGMTTETASVSMTDGHGCSSLRSARVMENARDRIRRAYVTLERNRYDGDALSTVARIPSEHCCRRLCFVRDATSFYSRNPPSGDKRPYRPRVVDVRVFFAPRVHHPRLFRRRVSRAPLANNPHTYVRTHAVFKVT